MPTYEYLCQTCSHRFETWQKMTDEPLTTCPECGGNIRRVFFPAGIVFKGHGFYKTDHASGSNGNSSHSEPKKAEGEKPAATENKSSETGTGSTEKTSSDSKAPAATTTTP